MTRTELLKVFLSDKEIQDKYGITPQQMESLNISQSHGNLMIDLCQQLVSISESAENGEITKSVAAAQLNSFLTNKLSIAK